MFGDDSRSTSCRSDLKKPVKQGGLGKLVLDYNNKVLIRDLCVTLGNGDKVVDREH